MDIIVIISLPPCNIFLHTFKSSETLKEERIANTNDNTDSLALFTLHFLHLASVITSIIK